MSIRICIRICIKIRIVIGTSTNMNISISTSIRMELVPVSIVVISVIVNMSVDRPMLGVKRHISRASMVTMQTGIWSSVACANILTGARRKDCNSPCLLYFGSYKVVRHVDRRTRMADPGRFGADHSKVNSHSLQE